jgi:hypothetical protein
MSSSMVGSGRKAHLSCTDEVGVDFNSHDQVLDVMINSALSMLSTMLLDCT